MKTNLFISLFISLMIIASCSKNDSVVDTQGNSYLTTSANSSWNYQETDSSTGVPATRNYTITATARDTSLNNKTYHVYTNTSGGLRFQNVTGSNYYQLDSLPQGLGTSVFDRLYLKDNGAVGTTWTQDLNVSIPGIPLPVPITIKNEITERDVTKSVSAVIINNVIHVSSSISSSFIPAEFLITAIDSYYAPRYGLIENSTIVKLDYLGETINANVHTKLISADLK